MNPPNQQGHQPNRLHQVHQAYQQHPPHPQHQSRQPPGHAPHHQNIQSHPPFDPRLDGGHIPPQPSKTARALQYAEPFTGRQPPSSAFSEYADQPFAFPGPFGFPDAAPPRFPDSVQAAAPVPSADYTTVDPTFDEGDAIEAYRQQQEFAQYVEEGDGNSGIYSNLVPQLSGGGDGAGDALQLHRRHVFGGHNSNGLNSTNHSNSSSTANMGNAYIAMSESTKNLYSLFTKLGDHGSRGPSMTNLSQMTQYYGQMPESAKNSGGNDADEDDDQETSGFWF